MGFIESLLGSGLANAIAFKATADAFNEEFSRSGVNNQHESTARTGIQKELLERADKAYKAKKYEIAIPLLIRVIKLDTYYPPYYSRLGNCYFDLGQFDIALECYDKALDCEGKVYVTTDEFRKSLRYLSKGCEKELNKNTPKDQLPMEEKEKNKNNKPTAKRVLTSPKRDTRKSNNRGG